MGQGMDPESGAVTVEMTESSAEPGPGLPEPGNCLRLALDCDPNVPAKSFSR